MNAFPPRRLAWAAVATIVVVAAVAVPLIAGDDTAPEARPTPVADAAKPVAAASPVSWSTTLSSASTTAAARTVSGTYRLRDNQTVSKVKGVLLHGDVSVAIPAGACPFFLSRLEVNGTLRDDAVYSHPGPATPGKTTGGYAELSGTYGGATYRVGANGDHAFIRPGADGTCFTDDDVVEPFKGPVSNVIRARLASSLSSKVTRKGSKVTVTVTAQRRTRTGTLTGHRVVKVQYRKPRTTTWRTAKTLRLNTSGRGSVTLKVGAKSAKRYYRVVIPTTDTVQGKTSTQVAR